MNRPARLNRALLALFGLLLAAAGAFALLVHARLLPAVDSTGPLVPGTRLPPTAVLVAAVVAAVVLGVLCVRWLAAQLVRGPRPPTWRAETGLGTAEFAAAAVATPVSAEVGSYPGVRSVRAVLSGPRTAPDLSLVVVLAHDADPAVVRERVHAEAVPRLREALEADTVAVCLEFRVGGADTAPRVR